MDTLLMIAEVGIALPRGGAGWRWSAMRGPPGTGGTEPESSRLATFSRDRERSASDKRPTYEREIAACPGSSHPNRRPRLARSAKEGPHGRIQLGPVHSVEQVEYVAHRATRPASAQADPPPIVQRHVREKSVNPEVHFAKLARGQSHRPAQKFADPARSAD